MKKYIFLTIGVLLFFMCNYLHAMELPIGEPVEKNGMRIAAIYLQSIVLAPSGMDTARGDSDIHIEADIHAIKGNKNGFGIGEWIPYLTITYTLVNLETGKELKGKLIPMVASDGPHYGANIKMNSIGKYMLKYHVEPPIVNGFGRHSDSETGVDKWWEAFDVKYTFKYFGAGKKGGY